MNTSRFIRLATKAVTAYRKEVKTPNTVADRYDATVDLVADLFHYAEAKFGPGSAQEIRERAWSHFIVEKQDA